MNIANLTTEILNRLDIGPPIIIQQVFLMHDAEIGRNGMRMVGLNVDAVTLDGDARCTSNYSGIGMCSEEELM